MSDALPTKEDRHILFDEGNHAELPALLAGGWPRGTLTRVFEKTTVRDGEPATMKWEVMATEKYGPPTDRDSDVYYALVLLSKERGWPRQLWFSLYEIVGILGWSHGGSSYLNARESIERLATLRVKSTNSFYDIATRSYRDEVWGFIETASVPTRERVKERSKPVNYIVWNEHFFQSFAAGYRLPMNWSVYRELDRPASKRLYPILNKRIGNSRRVWAVDIRELAHTHLGISKTRDTPARIREVLDPAIAEVKRKDGDVLQRSWFRKSGRVTKVFFQPSRERKRRAAPESAGADLLKQLQRRLFGSEGGRQRPEHVRAAESFVAAHGADAWPAFLDWAERYRAEQWPDMSSAGGALTLLGRFGEVLGETAARARKRRRKDWIRYIRTEDERMEAGHPQAYETFRNLLRTDRLYQEAVASYRSAEKSTTGIAEIRLDLVWEARGVRLAEVFREEGVQGPDEWAGHPETGPGA